MVDGYWTGAGRQHVLRRAPATSSACSPTRTSYGVYGDHGGAQKEVQRIPMAWCMPGMKHMVNTSRMRTVDIMPTFLRALGIKATDRMDGTAYALPLPK